ncbi:MAG: Ig-like domain-containing protein, partial [candidate division Zixibacteria bacterium]|nr:Ig-like domain-containing protein [candidate division Zixibacteria bacterium]
HMADNYIWQFHTIRDVTPPMIVFVRPGDEAVFKDSLKLQVAASDNDRMSHVEFYADGVLIPEASDSAAPYEYTWRPTGLVLGSVHSLYALAYDEAGNIGSTDTLQVHYLWHLLVEDNNEAIPRNLARIYYRTSRTQLSFRVETYNGWGDYKSATEGIDVAIFLDVDQNNATGQTTTDGGNQRIGDIGAEYRIVVGNHGDVLDRWNGSIWVNESNVDALVISNNSNFFEVSIGLPQLLDPQSIDLLVANVVLDQGVLLWDWAPNVNLGHVTATIDHSYAGSPPSVPVRETGTSRAASAQISPFN